MPRRLLNVSGTQSSVNTVYSQNDFMTLLLRYTGLAINCETYLALSSHRDIAKVSQQKVVSQAMGAPCK